MRFVIPESQGTFMSSKDRSAERKSQPQTAVAVCNLILPGKEHFKDLRFILLRDTGAIIGYIYHDITVFCIRRNIDPGAFLRVFDGVVHQIDNDLHSHPVRLSDHPLIADS